MKNKIIIIQLSIFTLFYTSCAKAQTLGAGVSVDNEGNLIINAPLYTFDRYDENPVLKKVSSSMNCEVNASIFYGQQGVDYLELKGGIKNGFLSLTVKKPDDNRLIEAVKFWSIPESSFTIGANVKIGCLNLSSDNGDFLLIWLYPNRNARILFKGSTEDGHNDIEGDHCEFIYSLDEVNIKGKYHENIPFNWYGDFNLRLKQGWNITGLRYYYDDTLKGDVEALSNISLSKDAVWVLLE